MAVMNRLRQINFLRVFLCYGVMWYVSIFFFLWTGGSGIITPGAALVCSFMVPSLIAFMAGVIITYRALSYDYIFMNQFGYFDLKDIFAFTAFCTLIQAVIYEQPVKKLKKETLQDPFGVQYLRHEYGKIKKRFSGKTKEEL